MLKLIKNTLVALLFISTSGYSMSRMATSLLLRRTVLPVQKTISIVNRNVALNGKSLTKRSIMSFVNRHHDVPTIHSTLDLNSHPTSSEASTETVFAHEGRHGSNHSEYQDTNSSNGHTLESIQQDFIYCTDHSENIIHEQSNEFLVYVAQQPYYEVLEQESLLQSELIKLNGDLNKALMHPEVYDIMQANDPQQALANKIQGLDNAHQTALCKAVLHVQELKNAIETTTINIDHCDHYIKDIQSDLSANLDEKLKNDSSVEALEERTIELKNEIQHLENASLQAPEEIRTLNKEYIDAASRLSEAKNKSVLSRLWDTAEVKALQIECCTIEQSLALAREHFDQNADALAIAKFELESIEQKLHELEQNLTNNPWQELGISSDACSLIHTADAKLAHLEDLSAEVQKDIVDLLNRGAQEQQNINDVSYDPVIAATVKIADTACQAYHKGNNELGSALVSCGNTILDCTVAFSKGFAYGVGNSVVNNATAVGNAVMHPGQTLVGLANGVVNAANFVLNHDGPLVALSLCPINSIVALGANVAESLVNTAKELSRMPLLEACEKLGHMTGEFGADLVILDGALKAASVVTKIVAAETIAILKTAEQELSAAGKLTQAERLALTESETLVVNAKKEFTAAIEAQQVQMSEKVGTGTLTSESRDALRFLPETGEEIGGRYYTKHALERMAPNTPEIRAQLATRAIEKGYLRGSDEFNRYIQPRNILPSMVEDVLKTVNPALGTGKNIGTLEYIAEKFKIVTNLKGDIVTIHPK